LDMVILGYITVHWPLDVHYDLWLKCGWTSSKLTLVTHSKNQVLDIGR
jgi:hypothetical protein